MTKQCASKAEERRTNVQKKLRVSSAVCNIGGDSLLEAVNLTIKVLSWPRDRFGRLDPAAVLDSHLVKTQLQDLVIKYRIGGCCDYMEQCAEILRVVANITSERKNANSNP